MLAAALPNSNYIKDTTSEAPTTSGPAHGRLTDAPSRPPRPLEVQDAALPAALAEHRQWVVWRYEWRPDRQDPDGGRWTKVPYQAQAPSRRASARIVSASRPSSASRAWAVSSTAARVKPARCPGPRGIAQLYTVQYIGRRAID